MMMKIDDPQDVWPGYRIEMDGGINFLFAICRAQFLLGDKPTSTC